MPHPLPIITNLPYISQDSPDLLIPLLTQLSSSFHLKILQLFIIPLFKATKLELHSTFWRILASNKMLIWLVKKKKVRQNKIHALLSFLLLALWKIKLEWKKRHLVSNNTVSLGVLVSLIQLTPSVLKMPASEIALMIGRIFYQKWILKVRWIVKASVCGPIHNYLLNDVVIGWVTKATLG